MMMMIWAALKASLWGTMLGRILAAVLAGLVALKLYGVSQQHVGAQRLATKIEQKAKENAKRSDDVRSKSLAGAGGVRDPHQRVD